MLVKIVAKKKPCFEFGRFTRRRLSLVVQLDESVYNKDRNDLKCSLT